MPISVRLDNLKNRYATCYFGDVSVKQYHEGKDASIQWKIHVLSGNKICTNFHWSKLNHWTQNVSTSEENKIPFQLLIYGSYHTFQQYFLQLSFYTTHPKILSYLTRPFKFFNYHSDTTLQWFTQEIWLCLNWKD